MRSLTGVLLCNEIDDFLFIETNMKIKKPEEPENQVQTDTNSGTTCPSKRSPACLLKSLVIMTHTAYTPDDI
ncbi:hypothetical protein P5673_030019 [Acropora cervicornis]|uniref:Uncharacterized protein n=1 Tax=Acropora cervicornis TaxID=6130 RepID=A0AAD9PV62_ACRCE|nr:hypothetical protein P5673_030019 [Acropora cervicornis]